MVQRRSTTLMKLRVPIVLLFILKDGIFLFAAHVQASREHDKHKHGTNNASIG